MSTRVWQLIFLMLVLTAGLPAHAQEHESPTVPEKSAAQTPEPEQAGQPADKKPEVPAEKAAAESPEEPQETPDTSPPPVEQAPAPEPVPVVEETPEMQATKYANEGYNLFEQGLYHSAVEMFQKAHQIAPNVDYIYNIAACYERLGDSQNCVDWFKDYLTRYTLQEGKAPEDIVDIRNSIAKCQIGAKVEIRIESEPDGAAISLDDKSQIVGQTPLAIRQDAGVYTLFVELENYQPIERKVEVRPGEPLRLVFKLEEIRRTGKIDLSTNIRGATIFIDGRNIGLTPYDGSIRVEEGPHQVTVSKDEYIPYSLELDVTANESIGVKSELYLRDPPTTWKNYLGWTALSIGTVMGVAGFFLGQQADTYFAGSDDFKQWEMYQRIGYWGGGSLFGTGLILLIWEGADTNMVKPQDELDVSTAPIRWAPIVRVAPDGGWAGTRVDF